MNIVVGTTKKQTTTDKGDILERLAGSLLGSLGYEIKTNLRVRGAELDLLCRRESNHSTEVYVECKAYGASKNIDSAIIHKLFGVRESEDYDEAWLISTSEFGKDAKGIVDQTERGKNKKRYTFITPEKFINQLVKANVIAASVISSKALKLLIPQKRMLNEPFLLFTDFGYFWVYDYKPNGEVIGYIFYDASSSEAIENKNLLNKIASIEQLDQNLNFSSLLEVLAGNGASRLSTESLELDKEYFRTINTMKFKLKDFGAKELMNDDVFVFPDLELHDNERSSVVNSGSILSDSESTRSVIYGDDLSGKSSLLQNVQVSLVGSSIVPIALSASEINVKTLKSFEKLLSQKFRAQYSDTPEHESYFEAILKSDKGKIAVLIDDLQDIGIKRVSSQYELMETITKEFENIAITIHRSNEVEFLARSDWTKIFSEYSHYNILQFGHAKRDQLIEKWLNACNGESMDDVEMHTSKQELADKINIATGKSFIPTHPFYLLTMLQVLESGSSNTVKGTAYGELYTFLIVNALGEAGAKSEDLDFYITYLSGLAYELFEEDTFSIDLITLEEFFKNHIDSKLIKKDFQQVHNLLLGARVLSEKDGEYVFQFDYVRYYLVAKHLSDQSSSAIIQQKVSFLVSNLYKDKYANIVIFLIHHSKSNANEIVKSILQEAQKLFEGIPVHTLSAEELSNFNDLITEHVSPNYNESDPVENRKKELELRDETSSDQRLSDDESVQDTMDLFDKINYSFRLMEVLGQIANNYYGSMDKDPKKDVLNELYNLGLRSLNALLLDYSEYVDGLKEMIKQTLLEKEENSQNIDKITNDIVYHFTRVIMFTFIKKTSDSVMSKNLFPAIEQLDHPPEHYSKHLVTTAIKLNFSGELNAAKEEILSLSKKLDKNYLTKDVLRLLVINHLYKHHVNHALKHSICANLGISITSNKAHLLSAKST